MRASTPSRARMHSATSRVPTPLSEAEATEDDGLSVNYLRRHCGTEDLSSVAELTLQVDSLVQGVESLGGFLRNLRQLRLRDSNIHRIRDLGTELTHLEVLWMGRCGLQDLSGIAAMPALREFYLPFNDVSDLVPLCNHDCLEVLDIEGNHVSNLEEVSSLKLCTQLRELTLAGNPVCRISGFTRRVCIDLLVQLTVLDDVEVEGDRETCSTCQVASGREGSPVVRYKSSNSVGGFSEEHVGPDLYGAEPDEDQLVLESMKRARLQHITSTRPTSASSSGLRVDDHCSVEAASDLTRGRPLGGNPLVAVRQRRNQAAALALEADMGIRELLQRYQTYMQESHCCGSGTPDGHDMEESLAATVSCHLPQSM